MRRLTDIEESALAVLRREGSILCDSQDLQPIAVTHIRSILDSLVKKKRAIVEATEAGPRYHPL